MYARKISMVIHSNEIKSSRMIKHKCICKRTSIYITDSSSFNIKNAPIPLWFLNYYEKV